MFSWFECNQPSPGEFAYSISGISTCWKAWIGVLGIPRSTFFNWKADFGKGRINPDHGSSLTIRPNLKSETAVHFMTKYFSENCDFLPTSDIWHLPSSSSRVDVFQEMYQTLKARNQPCCTQTHFVRSWKQHFPHVKIPKVELRLSLNYK